MTRRPVASTAALLAALAVAIPAVAQPADTTLRAIELFDLGLERKRAGDLDGACAAFADSERLESAVGTQLNLAVCLERDGKLAEAAAMLRAAAAAADARGDTTRAARARADLAALESRIAPHEPPPPVPAPGPVPVPEMRPASPAHVPPPPPRATPARPSRLTPLRTLALGAGAAGLAGLTVGTIRGLQARGYQHDSDATCPTTTCTSPAAVELNRRARSTGTQANVLFAVGVLAVAGGVALWVVGSPEDGVALVPTAGADHAGVALTGGF